MLQHPFTKLSIFICPAWSQNYPGADFISTRINLQMFLGRSQPERVAGLDLWRAGPSEDDNVASTEGHRVSTHIYPTSPLSRALSRPVWDLGIRYRSHPLNMLLACPQKRRELVHRSHGNVERQRNEIIAWITDRSSSQARTTRSQRRRILGNRAKMSRFRRHDT